MTTIAPARPVLADHADLGDRADLVDRADLGDRADHAALRRALLTQRAFRLEQLGQLDRQRGTRPLSGAYREVYVSLAVGARSALQDIESALRRMDEGRYGVCVACGQPLDPQLLNALPQAARCLPCRRGAAGA